MNSVRRTTLAFLVIALLVPPLLILGRAHAASSTTHLTKQLAGVRQVAARYQNVSAAIADGYIPTKECLALKGVGAMGYHYINPARMGHLNPMRPDILLYAPSASGPKLTGVEYFKPVSFRHPDGTVSIWMDRFKAPPAGWTALPGPSLFGQRFNGPMAGHTNGMPWHYDLHVWLFQTNPSGLFAQWNPSVHC